MTFAEVRFPTDISYGSSGGPEYSTDIVEIASGYEQRNSNWADARARYNVAHGVKTKAQLDALIAFFRARKGRAQAFRFKDWTDFKATAELIGLGNGSATTFQLKKKYSSGGVDIYRDITKPVSGTVKIFVNGIEQTIGVTVNNSNGLVTFLSAPSPAASITATFEFDVPARFDTDRLSSSIDTYGSSSWYDIPLIEVRV